MQVQVQTLLVTCAGRVESVSAIIELWIHSLQVDREIIYQMHKWNMRDLGVERCEVSTASQYSKSWNWVASGGRETAEQI